MNLIHSSVQKLVDHSTSLLEVCLFWIIDLKCEKALSTLKQAFKKGYDVYINDDIYKVLLFALQKSFPIDDEKKTKLFRM